jgi:hypothetical protein
MSELARVGSGDHVVVYRCLDCHRVTTLGYATRPGRVGARARQFLRLRAEALQLVHFIVDVNVANSSDETQ